MYYSYSGSEPLYNSHPWGMKFWPLYRGVALSQGWICTNRAHLGHNEVSLIEGVAFMRGSTVYNSFLQAS